MIRVKILEFIYFIFPNEKALTSRLELIGSVNFLQEIIEKWTFRTVVGFRARGS